MSHHLTWYRRTGLRRASGAGPAGGGVPLPPAIFQGNALFAYIASPPHIVVGAGPTVTLLHNVVSPGTLDSVPSGNPAYLPGGFLDGRNAIQFDGATQVSTTAAIGVPALQRNDIYTVCQYSGALPSPIALRSFDGGVWYGIFRASGTLGVPMVMAPFGPISGNAGPYDNGGLALFGTQYGGDVNVWVNGTQLLLLGGQVGSTNPLTTFSFGGNGGANFWPGTFAELVCVVNDDPNGNAHRLAYQNSRLKRLYPSIPLP